MLLFDLQPSPRPQVEVIGTRAADGYTEQLLHYPNREGETVRAFLLIPDGASPFPGVVAYHQHNSEWHLGKSEVAGLAGDRLQAFGPALARRGTVVLAPDAICFEDRRRNGDGIEPRDDDWLQHYNEMSYRLVQGSLLMSLVLADAALAVSVLAGCDVVEAAAIGVVGHSMGGHTVLFGAGLDERVRFACASGAASSYRARVASGTGLEMAQVIPGILTITDLDGLVGLIAPRPLLLVSASEDPYSRDAPAVELAAAGAYAALGASDALEHARYAGGHTLTEQRLTCILDWLVDTGRRAQEAA